MSFTAGEYTNYLKRLEKFVATAREFAAEADAFEGSQHEARAIRRALMTLESSLARGIASQKRLSEL
jgi:hypothetical protein